MHSTQLGFASQRELRLITRTQALDLQETEQGCSVHPAGCLESFRGHMRCSGLRYS